MKYLLAVLFLVGCAGDPAQTGAPVCHNVTREFTVGVPYSWDVMDDEETSVMNDGCLFITITHYVLDDGSGGGGAGGSGPDPFHCDVDACDGPYDKRVTYSDPAPDKVVLNTNSVANDGQTR